MNLTFQFESLEAFVAMGRYGFYVWLSYGTAAIALGTLIIHSVRMKKNVIKEIAKKQERDARLRSNRSSN